MPTLAKDTKLKHTILPSRHEVPSRSSPMQLYSYMGTTINPTMSEAAMVSSPA